MTIQRVFRNSDESAAWATLGRFLVALALCVVAIGEGRAQDEADEFGDEKPDSKAAAQSDERKLRPSGDPAVRALLATKPTTPEELLAAIEVLVDLRATDDAYVLLRKLVQSKPDDDAWANLVEKHGSALFLRLALIEGLQPEGREMSDAALGSADRRARDPGRLATLIDKLADPSAASRRGAMTRLLGGREAAIQLLASALVDPARQRVRPAIRETLARFGREALAPLTAMARSPQAAVQTEAIYALGDLGLSVAVLDLLAPALLDTAPPEARSAAREALMRLIGRLPQADEAVATLLSKARSSFAEALQEQDPDTPPAPEWRWDDEKSTLVYGTTSPLAIRLEQAANWASDAARLAPRRREALWLALASRIEAEAVRTGADGSEPTGAVAALAAEDAYVVEGTLGFALRSGHTVAATAVARVLGQIGTSDLLYTQQPQPGSLVEAARSSDRRLRYAALEAIMRLKPKRPYPGSSHVVEALGYLAGSFAAPRVMAADARSAEAERQAGLLAGLGYETDVATSPRAVVAETVSSPDYLFALIDYTLAAPTSGELLQRLRRDNRTARLPIGIVASTDDLDSARRLAQKIPLATVIYRPVDTAGLDWQLQRLLAQAGQRMVAPDERLRQARQALDWLTEMAAAPRGIYNLRRVEGPLTVALQVAELSPPAAAVLGVLGTAPSQQALVDLISQPAQPLDVRRAAGRAFAESVARFGTLLTTSEIGRQYDRHNQSLGQDADSQALLASILDTIEARSAADQADE
ncbi:MAG TPA: HEAT repeat domain-containing protein [Pirellulales bacterium]|nr:HEAT repeat domain-containing protein [Pirellulales bacterium]